MLAEAPQFYGYRAFAATVPEAEETLQRLGRAAIQLVIANAHLTSDPQTREGYMLARRGCGAGEGPLASSPPPPEAWLAGGAIAMTCVRCES